MKGVGLWAVGAVLVGFGVACWSGMAGAQSGLPVADGLKVSIEYTLSLPEKGVVESNVGKAPMSYTQGAHQIIPGLEKALVGMTVGQHKRVDVPPEQGYGVYDQNAKLTVEKARVPPDVKAGTRLSSPDGRPVTVLEVSEKSVVLDLNHPLAGKTLVFDVKILNVEKPAPPPSAEKTP